MSAVASSSAGTPAASLWTNPSCPGVQSLGKDEARSWTLQSEGAHCGPSVPRQGRPAICSLVLCRAPMLLVKARHNLGCLPWRTRAPAQKERGRRVLLPWAPWRAMLGLG